VHGPPNCLLSRISGYVSYNSSDCPVLRQPRANSHLEHRTVRCPPEQETSQSRDSLPLHCSVSGVQQTVQCASDSPVHPRTEGNQSLPIGAPTTPRSLGAIKRTPRHMEHYTKHPLNILRHRDTAVTLEL
jgi:hypothetical protein